MSEVSDRIPQKKGNEMAVYTVRLAPNDVVFQVEGENENEALDKAVKMATGGYVDLWDLFHHCGMEIE